MEKTKLIKDQWYKFSPYAGRIHDVWYMKYSGTGWDASEYINHEGNYRSTNGSFSDYTQHGPGYDYQPATAEEVNKYLPEDKKLPEIPKELPIFN